MATQDIFERIVAALQDDLFINEDLSKPENRINVALFGLMPQDWFREWFLKKLNLSSDAVVYPPKTYKGYRPDLKAVSGDSTLAWIEVELGADEAQAKRYEKEYCEPVKRVWGKRSDTCDLSLEEIADRLDNQKDLPEQTQMNVAYLRKLIRKGLDGHTSSPGQGPVSEEMRGHPLVAGLKKKLGCRFLIKDVPTVPPVGYLGAYANGPRGFSLQVKKPKGGKVFLLNISGNTGLETVNFPTKEHLKEHLPDRLAQIEAYVSLLGDMGLDIDVGNGHTAGSLPLKTVLGKLDELASCVQALALGDGESGHIVE